MIAVIHSFTSKCDLEHFTGFSSPDRIQGGDTEVIRLVKVHVVQHVVVNVTDVLYFPVPAFNFVLKNEHGHWTVPVIPFAPGDVQSRRVMQCTELYHCWW